jgi:hypothetical protein
MATTNTARLEMNPAGLYREEVFTDREAGTIRVLTPVKTDGLIDATRSVLYLGEAQILTAPAAPTPRGPHRLPSRDSRRPIRSGGGQKMTHLLVGRRAEVAIVPADGIEGLGHREADERVDLQA